MRSYPSHKNIKLYKAAICKKIVKKRLTTETSFGIMLSLKQKYRFSPLLQLRITVTLYEHLADFSACTLECGIFVYHTFFCREDTTIKELQTNGQIRDREIRLIGSDGQQLGIVSSYEGQRIADESGLDLVKISPNSNPPVCRIMDYSKYKYEQNKKEKEMRRNQKTIEVKEVWLSMTIDIGDLNTKANIARKFLNDGNKVKATIRMRGRQQAYAQQGVEVMKKFAEILSDVSKIDKQPTTEGRNISMFLVPLN